MKALRHPLTWRTTCFIGEGNVGCGAETFAHTNGDGDFVLFDSLGPPWPIHSCYLNRNIRFDADWRKGFDIELKKPKKAWRNSSDIQRVNPLSRSSKEVFYIVGYLQERHLAKRDEWLRKVSGLGEHVLLKALGRYPDQLTIVAGDPDAGLQSFTAFGDIKKLHLREKDMVRATLRAVPFIAIKNKDAVFVADDIAVLRW